MLPGLCSSRTERCAPACRQFLNIAGSHWQPSPPARSVQKRRAALYLPAWDRDPAEGRNTRAGIANAWKRCAERSPQMVQDDGEAFFSCVLLPFGFPFSFSVVANHPVYAFAGFGCDRLLVQNEITVRRGLEFSTRLGDGLFVANKKISSGFEVFVKAVDERSAARLTEVIQHIDAKDNVEAANITRLRQIHLREGDHVAHLGPNEVLITQPGEIRFFLPGTERHKRLRRIKTAFSPLQRFSADVGGQNVNVPGAGKLQRVANPHGDGIRFLTGGASRAPYSQAAWILPELFLVHLPQHLLFQYGKNGRMAQEISFLGQQVFQQLIVFQAGATNNMQQVRGMRHFSCAHVFVNPDWEVTLLGIVEKNSRTFCDERADFGKLMPGHGHIRGLVFFRHSTGCLSRASLVLMSEVLIAAVRTLPDIISGKRP